MRKTINDNENGGGLMQNRHVRRIAIYAGVLLAAFLLGLIPMWLTARERSKELGVTQASLRVSRLQNNLANAALEARRGDYEAARQTMSDFFTDLRKKVEREPDSAFAFAQTENLRRELLAGRDDTITILARGDSASVERLADLHQAFRRAVGDALVMQQQQQQPNR